MGIGIDSAVISEAVLGMNENHSTEEGTSECNFHRSELREDDSRSHLTCPQQEERGRFLRRRGGGSDFFEGERGGYYVVSRPDQAVKSIKLKCSLKTTREEQN